MAGSLNMKGSIKIICAGAAGLALLLPLAAGAWPVPSPAEKARDEMVSGFSRALGFSERINPLPASEKKERARFFKARRAGRTYEPQFTYSPITKKALAAARRLDEPAPAGPYAVFLDEARLQLKAKLKILQARGAGEFTALGAALYPLPAPEEVAAASATLKELGWTPPARPAGLSDADMAEQLGRALQDRGLHNWSVRISAKMSASASVLPGSRVVKIKKGRRFAAEEVFRLVEHEIGVHARRAENGHAMPLGIFRVGLEGYLETEEGMAAWRERESGINDGLRLFALRVLAVHWASRLPFSAVFDNLSRGGVPDDLAWALTQRVKRGLTDTGRPGCYPKDVSYFRGYLKVKAFLAAGGSWDELMKYGKVSMDHLPALRALEAGKK
ncbi:MAG: hypothetical protein CVU79_08765 [Elusimicrobia bacterium HGW-Elusimicrobia-3]|jgi:hypothetical protein|nr:MAG: hypothetical protein CVU79_08765 [Elusimicrobia bacterium HGW-Elusimicrobia-3]